MPDVINTQAMKLIHKSLDFRRSRQDIIASNIANIHTPGYKAEDLVFEKALGKALHADDPGTLNVSNARHLDGNDVAPLDTVEAERIQSAAPFAAFDGNTVDLDKEMAKIAENQLMYDASMRMMSHQFKQLKLVTEGR